MKKSIQTQSYDNVLAATDTERKRFNDLLISGQLIIPEKTFILHWIGQDKPEEVKGITIAKAFAAAGYGAGALRALDWYEEKNNV